jgi:hypothetical protein
MSTLLPSIFDGSGATTTMDIGDGSGGRSIGWGMGFRVCEGLQGKDVECDDMHTTVVVFV